MKTWNWGTGIVLAFVLFIGFILFFVIRMSTDTRADHDLVTKEYYQQELAYQEEIDAEKNARALGAELKIEKTAQGLRITLPKALQNSNSKGTMSLYRPSNKHLDFDMPIRLSKTHLLIPDKRLLDGRWDIKIRIEHEGVNYLFKERITY